MKLLNNILFATDFLESSHSIFNYVIDIARTFGSNITLLHSVPNIEKNWGEEEYRKKGNEIEFKMAAFRKILHNQGINESTSILTGNVQDNIIHQAELLDVSMIIVGKSNDVKKDRLGSVTKNIVRRSSKPIMIIKNNARFPIKRILCPVDLSEASERHLKNAIYFARKLKAKLSILYVVDNLKKSMTMVDQDLLSAARKQLILYSENDLSDFLKNFDLTNVKWEKLILDGSPGEEILSILNKKQFDLLCIGSDKKNTWWNIFVENDYEKIARYSTCSLMIFNTQDAIRYNEAIVDNTMDLFKRGGELLAEGMAHEAITHFKKCLAHSNTFLCAHEKLVDAYRRIGHEENVKKHLKEVFMLKKRLSERKIEALIRYQARA